MLVLAALAALGCASSSAGTTTAPPTDLAAASPEASEAPLLIELQANAITVAGATSGSSIAELRASIQQHARGSRAAVLRAAVDADALHVLHVLKASEGALETLTLQAGEHNVDISRGPGRGPAVTLLVTAVGPTLSEPGASAKPLPFTPGYGDSELQAKRWLEQRCSAAGCRVELQVEPGIKVRELAATLASLSTFRQELSALSIDAHSTPAAKGPENTGYLAPAVIQRTIESHFGVFEQCYQAGLAQNASLRGKVVARFLIGRNGQVERVEDAGSELADDNVRQCVLGAMRNMRFPAPDGGSVLVTYPVTLAPPP